MKNSLRLVRLLLLTLAVPGITTAQTLLVDRFANNLGPGSPADQVVRLINVGQLGNPMTSPVGDVCANIYVFDNNQEMIACCSCRLTPNEMASAWVAKELTSNPLTSVIPKSGVILILPIMASGTNVCTPIAPFATSDASLVQGFSTHVEVSGWIAGIPTAYMTETPLRPSPLGSQQAAFLSNSCLFVQYLGGSSGKGGCGCTAPGY